MRNFLLVFALFTSFVLLSGSSPVDDTGRSNRNVLVRVPDVSDTHDDYMLNIKKIIGARRQVIELLLVDFRRRDIPDETKGMIAYALGELRSREAVKDLVDNIDFAFNVPVPPLSLPSWTLGHPAREALIKIGNSSATRVIEVIGSSSYSENQITGYAEVLKGTLGLSCAESRLEYEKEKAKNEEIAARYEKVIVAMK